jgi:hypothetical protein
MDMKTFTEFWKGMFFFVSTLTLSVFLYLVVMVWQPLWTDGFRNFGDISKAIIRLDRTAKPVAEMAPLMLGEMDEMRKTMVKMQQSMEPHDLGHRAAHGYDDQRDGSDGRQVFPLRHDAVQLVIDRDYPATCRKSTVAWPGSRKVLAELTFCFIAVLC